MLRIEKTVFISYRRKNDAIWARAVRDDLLTHGYDVFVDFESIGSGAFERVIVESIKARAHFLVLLSPSALDRCGEHGDVMRLEIETAIETERNVVPLLLHSFDFQAPTVLQRLKGKLALLAKYNGLRVEAESLHLNMDQLRDRFLNVPLDAVLHPASQEAQTAAQHQLAAAHRAPPVREEELTARQWAQRGYAAFDADEQNRCYTEAIRLNPNDFEAYNNRGNAHCSKFQFDWAIFDFADAMRLNPGEGGYYFNRAIARKGKGDLDGTKSDLSDAIRLNPGFEWGAQFLLNSTWPEATAKELGGLTRQEWVKRKFTEAFARARADEATRRRS